ncbi:MAG: N-acetyltransferase [Patescibacteria group bacterium]
MLTKKEIAEQSYKINRYYSEKGLTKRYSKKDFSTFIRRKELNCKIKDKKVIAFTVIKKYPSIPERVNLGVIAVRPYYRKKGYGKKILQSLFENFRGKNVILNVNSKNTHAVNFYKKNGFRVIRIRKDENDFIMQKSLVEIKRTRNSDGSTVWEVMG